MCGFTFLQLKAMFRCFYSKIKIVKERGSAGHKGVESIIKSIGNDNLVRFRIGIGPENKPEAIKIVLENFSQEERERIDETILKTVDALGTFINNGLSQTMNQYN
jgi:PTH1 family peptidyl-tRNA hydrolase